MDFETLQVNEISEREREIISLIADGLTNQEIADRVYLSKNTIKWYIQQLNQKLYTESREEIVAEAQQLGLLDSRADVGVAYQLPRQTTVFIGREAELDTLHDIFANDDVRLLTILAPGGMGKTRIALELLEQNLNTFRDGVYFIALQAVPDVESIITQIAISTGLQISSTRGNVREQLLNFLSRKHLVLLLDNFEHLLVGGALINDILKAAPNVKLIVTSRERLTLISETVYPLGGMRYSQWETADEALDSDAVQLLQQTARRMQAGWSVTEDNLAAVARLCKLTDGMPLGILLAASWMDVFTLTQICEEIEKSADILSTEWQDIPYRQRSIRAIFDYTWERLDRAEQVVLMKMSVFRDGCTADAAQTIADSNPRILQKLISKALLSHRNGRYEFHELLRQYAEEHLKLADLSQETAVAHMSYYANLLHSEQSRLKGRGQLEAIALIDSDFENITAMWYQAIQGQHSDIVDKTLEALRIFFLLSNRMDIGATWFSDAIAALENDPQYEQILLKLQVYYADTLLELSQIEEGFTILKDVEDPVLQSGDTFSILQLLISLNRSSYIRGQIEVAKDYMDSHLELATKEGDLWHLAQYHFASALISGQTDRHAPLQHVEQCIAIATKMGDIYWRSQGYTVSGLMYRRIGELRTSITHTEKVYQYCQQLNDKMGMVGALNNLAENVKTLGDWQACKTYLREAVLVAQDLGYSYHYAWVSNKLAYLYLIQGEIEQAEQAVAIVEDITYTMDYPALHITQYVTMSAIAEYKGSFVEGHRLAVKAHEFEGGVNWAVTQVATERLAWALCCIDAYDEAVPHLMTIAEQHIQLGGIWHLLTDIAAFSMVYAHHGQYERAAEMLGFVLQHDVQAVWMNQHPKLLQLRQQLKDELGEDAYQHAWDSGQRLEAVGILKDVLADFGQS